MHPEDRPLPGAPVAIMVAGLLAAIILSGAYASWDIDTHARQACDEYHALATATGTGTPYDRTVRQEFTRIYRLRCQ